MLNKEKQEMINALIELIKEFNPSLTINPCLNHFREKTKYSRQFSLKEIVAWLNSEYEEPFKITQAEKYILENLDEDTINEAYLSRHTYNEGLYIYYFASDEKEDGKIYELPFYSHLFPFLEKGDSIGIKDILENFEVIKND